MPSPPTAIVVLRTQAPKLRLASVLGAAEREHLVLEMFVHVTRCLLTAGLDVVALSRGPVEVPAGVELMTDGGPTLNASLDRAIATVGVPVMVMASDLPWLTARSVEVLLDQPGDVVVAATEDGGTAGLLLHRAVPAAFGPRSTLAHAAAAHALGLRVRVVRIPGLDRDLDDPVGHRLASGRAPALA